LKATIHELNTKIKADAELAAETGRAALLAEVAKKDNAISNQQKVILDLNTKIKADAELAIKTEIQVNHEYSALLAEAADRDNAISDLVADADDFHSQLAIKDAEIAALIAESLQKDVEAADLTRMLHNVVQPSFRGLRFRAHITVQD